jgi:hypothetical protein
MNKKKSIVVAYYLWKVTPGTRNIEVPEERKILSIKI